MHLSVSILAEYSRSERHASPLADVNEACEDIDM